MNGKVYVIIEMTSVDYHGSYREIIAIYANKEDADKRVKELEELNCNYNIEYYVDAYNLL